MDSLPKGISPQESEDPIPWLSHSHLPRADSRCGIVGYRGQDQRRQYAAYEAQGADRVGLGGRWGRGLLSEGGAGLSVRRHGPNRAAMESQGGFLLPTERLYHQPASFTPGGPRIPNADPRAEGRPRGGRSLIGVPH